MKMKERYSRLKSKCNKDWCITILIVIVLLMSFFVQEQKNEFNKWFMNIVYLCAGIGGFIYICYAVRVLFNMIELDMLWIKNTFLHKVVNLVMLVPFTIMMSFVLCNGVIPNLWKKYKTNEKYSTISECQKNFAKELIFAENLYDQDNITIDVENIDTLFDNHNKQIAKLTGWELVKKDSVSYCYVKSVDKLPKDIVDKSSEEPSLFWSVYYHYIDPGNQHIAMTESGRKWAAIISILGYLLLNGLLVAVLIGWFDRRRENWENGMVRYKLHQIGKNKFAVVFGANEVAASVIKNLFTKRQKGEINFKCEGDNDYVILQTNRNANEVRDELAAYLSKDDLEKVIIYKALRNSKQEIKKLYLKYATEIYVLGESTSQENGETNHDALNMRCVNLITENLREENADRKVCKVMFEYQATYSVFQFADVTEDIKARLDFIPFNRYESWARKVIVESFSEDSIGNRIDYTPLDGKEGIAKDSDEHVHFVIVGMSKMGIAMGVQALSQAHYMNYANAENIEDACKREQVKNKVRTRITFIDTNADKEMDFFKGRYANIFELVRHRYIDSYNYDRKVQWMDPMQDSGCKWKHLCRAEQNFLDVEIEFVKGELESQGVRQFLHDISDKNDEFVKKSKLTIAICLTQTHQAIAASLYMPVEVYEKAQDIWVYQSEVSDIIRNLENTTSAVSGRYRKIHPFGMLYGEYMSDRSQYLKALLVNWAYTAEKEGKGWPSNVVDDPIMSEVWKSWRKLTLDKQWSNRNFADYIYVKERSVGKTVLKDLKEHKDVDLLLGIAEHNRWDVEQLLFGYFPCVIELDKIFEKINTNGMSDDIKEEYDLWKKRNGVSETDYKKIKDDVKASEYRRHPNICEFEHLDVVDKDAKGYDSMLNNAIVKILALVDYKKNDSKLEL